MHKITYYFMNDDDLVMVGDLESLNSKAWEWIHAKKKGESQIIYSLPNGRLEAIDVSMAYKVEVALDQ